MPDFVRPQTPWSNILAYAASAGGKSTFIAQTIKYLWEEYGLRSRVVGADGGGTQNAIGPAVDAGIADYWPIDQWADTSIFTLLDLATKGYWPEDVETPNSKLIPSVKEFKACPHCGGDSGAKGLTSLPACLACKQVFPAGTMLKLKREAVNGLEKVGLLAFEGLTAFGNLLLRRLAEINPDGGRSITDGDGTNAVKISAPGLQHYGDAQDRLARCVANNRMVPVPIIIWTALESRGEDEGKPVYGPKGPGKALATQALQWFTDVLHLDVIPKTDARGLRVKDSNGIEVVERKIFLQPHFPPDAPNQIFRAKVTSAPAGSDIPMVMVPDAAEFFRMVRAAREKAVAAIQIKN